MSKRFHAAALLTLAVGLAGCNYYDEKDTDDGDVAPEEEGPVDVAKLSYDSIVADVLKPKCFSCHSNSGGSSGGLNTESYAAVKAKLSVMIDRTVTRKDMPIGGSLSAGQLAKIKAWLEAGAPETASALSD